MVYGLQKGQAQPHVYSDDIAKIKIPILAKKTREKIIEEVSLIEEKELVAIQSINAISAQIQELFEATQNKADKSFRLSNQNNFKLSIGKRVLSSDLIKIRVSQ